jgi:hypothetical protein
MYTLIDGGSFNCHSMNILFYSDVAYSIALTVKLQFQK